MDSKSYVEAASGVTAAVIIPVKIGTFETAYVAWKTHATENADGGGTLCLRRYAETPDRTLRYVLIRRDNLMWQTERYFSCHPGDNAPDDDHEAADLQELLYEAMVAGIKEQAK